MISTLLTHITKDAQIEAVHDKQVIADTHL